MDPADIVKVGFNWDDKRNVDAVVAFSWVHNSTAFHKVLCQIYSWSKTLTQKFLHTFTSNIILASEGQVHKVFELSDLFLDLELPM